MKLTKEERGAIVVVGLVSALAVGAYFIFRDDDDEPEQKKKAEGPQFASETTPGSFGGFSESKPGGGNMASTGPQFGFTPGVTPTGAAPLQKGDRVLYIFEADDPAEGARFVQFATAKGIDAQFLQILPSDFLGDANLDATERAETSNASVIVVSSPKVLMRIWSGKAGKRLPSVDVYGGGPGGKAAASKNAPFYASLRKKDCPGCIGYILPAGLSPVAQTAAMIEELTKPGGPPSARVV